MASKPPLSRTIRRVVVLYGLVVMAVLLGDLRFLPAGERPVEGPRHHVLGGFRNVSQDYSYPLLQRMRGFLRHHRASRHALVLVSNDGDAIRHHAPGPAITWVGHSTFLIQIDGLNILTDPHWGDRASPVRFAGPRRMIPPGVRFEDLPPIDAVVISHDHYDHLDEETVRRLAREHHPRFFVPLRVGAWLASHGIDGAVELDWWDHADFRGLTVTCTPAQHSSGRGLDDQNRRLWSSWVIAGPTKRLFFAGDTGYYPGLREIGDRLGPFDLAAIPIGGYSDYRKHHPNHVNPEEAIQLFEDVRGRVMVPMHWGTFDFNREPPSEPPKRLTLEARRRRLEDRIAVLSPGQTIRW
jgi:N-acyl-phosphatidylethanolamine-hydrolysing phospholipase D